MSWYSFPSGLVKLIVRRMASRRLIWPSTMFPHVGEFASSKSAMNIFRAGVQRIDHHLAIGRSRDLDPPIPQILRDRRAGPIALANLFRFRQKIERSAAIERRLPLLTALPNIPAAAR